MLNGFTGILMLVTQLVGAIAGIEPSKSMNVWFPISDAKLGSKLIQTLLLRFNSHKYRHRIVHWVENPKTSQQTLFSCYI